MQVPPSSSSLFCGLTGANSQGPTPSEPQGPAMCLAGQDMTPAAPSTLVGYNKPLQVNDDALTRVGHNKPLLLNATTSATAGSTATPPKADPMEIAALELLLAEPANQDMVQHFGGPLKPLPTDTATGQGIQARYGADLGARLSQLQTAQQAVREEYRKAVDNAAPAPGPNTPGSVYVPEVRVPADNYQPARWDFDPVAFTQHYASGGSPAQKAFAQLHGSEPLYFKPSLQEFETPGDYVRNGERGQYVLDDPLQPTFRLSATDDTELINKENLWFDPVHGWSTDEDNLKGDWIDKLSPVLMGGFLAFCTGGALSSVMGVAPGSMTVAQSAAIGASSSAVIQLVTTGKLDFGNMLRSALTAGMATGIMDASGMGDMLKAQDLGTRMTAHLGKAGMQGVLQQAIGGKFKDGFANSLLSSAASEVGAHLDQQIKAQLPELDPAQASALKLLSRAATSALRIAGSNDPAASFANDFLMGALQDAAADRKRGQEGQEGQEGREGAQKPGTAQGGEKPSSAWVDRLGRSSLGPRVSDEALSRWSDEIDGGIALNGSMAPGQISQAVVGPNQGPLAALAAAGLDAQQQRAMYGQLLANGQIQLNAQGVPIVQPGQVLEFDLSDMGGSTLGGHAIGGESAMRAQRETAEAAARASTARKGMSAEEAGDIYMAYGGRSASHAGSASGTALRQRSLEELIEMSHAPVERYSAQEYRNAAAEYRARMGRDFSRDSIYNGLWTRAAAQDGAVGKGWGQDVVNDMTGVATEAGVHAQTGMATGAAAAGMAARRGNHSGIVGGLFGANGGTEVINESLASLNSPATRHYADKVTQTTVAKEVNTVIDRSVVDISADVSAIRSGQSRMIGDTFVVNGRTYGMHDGTLYPMSGPGLYTLDRGGYKALGVLNKFGDTPQAQVILNNMGVSAETKAAALIVFKAIKK